MTWLNCIAGMKHPDEMKRADMIKMIKAFDDDKKAMSWWLKHASHRVSKKSFNKARGYE